VALVDEPEREVRLRPAPAQLAGLDGRVFVKDGELASH
jgi:hypothetical protein